MRGAHAFLDENLSFRDMPLTDENGDGWAHPPDSLMRRRSAEEMPNELTVLVSHFRKRASEFVGS